MACDCEGEGPCGCEGIDQEVINGIDGQTPTISVVLTETLPAGQPAEVLQGGTPFNVQLTFRIPAGVDGINGTNGISPWTTVTTAFTQPDIGAAPIWVDVANSSWAALGLPVFIPGGGFYRIFGVVPGQIALVRLAAGASGFFPTGNAVPVSSLLVPAGQAGGNSYGNLTASFNQPAVGGTVSVTADWVGWMAVGGWVYIEGGGHYIVQNIISNFTAVLRNPSATDLQAIWGGVISDWTAGLPLNAAAPTTIVSGARVNPSGVPGPRGGQGLPGGAGPSAFQVAQAEGYGGTASAWLGTLVGPAGARGTLTTHSPDDPNVTPPAGAVIGDYHWRIQVNQLDLYVMTASAWSLLTTIVGSAPSVLAGVFRVGKVAAQPLPTGSTAAVLLQLEDWLTSGRYNYGPWDGSKATLATPVTPQTFVLENLTISNNTPEAVDFVIDILLNGVSQANATLSFTAEASLTLPVLTTGPIAVADTDEVQVSITPSAGTTSQFQVNASGVVFYNQR